MNPRPFRVISCEQWGARPPKTGTLPIVKRPNKAIFHHTAGHSVAGDSGETYAQAVAYVKSIQNFHMDDPDHLWNDTGQNFTVTRNGYIFEGRHGSLARVRRGQMVVSAHCPRQNDQPGVEIEHMDPEPMTPIQREAAVWLFAWICKCCTFPATHIYGHRDYYSTACPGALYAGLPQFRLDVAKQLKPSKRHYYQVLETDTRGLNRVVIQSKRTYVIPADVVRAQIQRN